MGHKKKIVNSITIGRGKKKRILPIIIEYVELSEDENRKRIQRLARKILRVVDAARMEKVRQPRGEKSNLAKIAEKNIGAVMDDDFLLCPPDPDLD